MRSTSRSRCCSNSCDTTMRRSSPSAARTPRSSTWASTTEDPQVLRMQCK
jgi:hypothetical protein